MSRTENPELKKRLEAVIQRSLCTRGLDATSYKLIADEVGISRALVQHYFPRKMDFIVNFRDRLLSSSANILGIVEYEAHSNLNYLDAYRIGCLLYEYLLREDGARRMFFDLLKDRELTDEMMLLHYEWGLANINASLPSYESRSQEVIETWGGFYELMYRSIKENFEVYLPEKLYQLLKAFHQGESESFGAKAEFIAACPASYLTDELVARMDDFVERHVKAQLPVQRTLNGAPRRKEAIC